MNHGVDCSFEVGTGHHAVDQADLKSRPGVDGLTGQQEFHGAARADNTRIDDGAKRWENSQLDFRLAELRAVGGDHQVAEGRQFAARAGSDAVNDGQDRLGHVHHGAEDGMESVHHLEDQLLRVALHAHAQGEVAFALRCGFQHDQSHVLAMVQALDGGGHLIEHIDVHHVLRRPGHGEAGDSAGIVPADEFVTFLGGYRAGGLIGLLISFFRHCRLRGTASSAAFPMAIDRPIGRLTSISCPARGF
jgi:hypothetical protein